MFRVFVHLSGMDENVEKIDEEKVDDFYKSNSWSVPFLMTEEGKQYQKAFETLRLQHIISSCQQVEKLKADNIIPHSLIESASWSNWQSLMRVEQNLDKGYC